MSSRRVSTPSDALIRVLPSALFLALVALLIAIPQDLSNQLGVSYKKLILFYNRPWDPEPVISSHSYTVHLFSKDPLIIYISSFISPDEAAHLVGLA
jgi:hypothetical protein